MEERCQRFGGISEYSATSYKTPVQWQHQVSQDNKKKLSGLVRQRTIPTERSQLVGEVSANFSGYKVSRGQRNESPPPLISIF
jgi:hypothetical protein